MANETRFCLRCKGEIPWERIDALPDTQVCVRCSQTIGGEYEITVVPENLGKCGSLKKNYGNWKIKKKRKRIVPEKGPLSDSSRGED